MDRNVTDQASNGKPVKIKNVVSNQDRAVLEAGYSFVPPDRKRDTSWKDRMVSQYESKLYREYALADFSRPGAMGLRWRTEKEVRVGRGESSCGNKRCDRTDGLTTFEVPFAYVERGTKKKELVKLCLCTQCRPFLDAIRKKWAQPINNDTHTEEAKSKTSSRHVNYEADEDSVGIQRNAFSRLSHKRRRKN